MSNYRSDKILKLANQSPHCMACGAWNRGQVVAAHSNSICHGKGTGVKAHDIPAYLCDKCHDAVDGRTGNLDRRERELMFLNAMYNTLLWLLQEGHVQVAK